MKKFEELLNKVPSTGTKELPKANNLPDSNVLIEMERGDFKITVYENGLYVYTEGKRTTVYAVDRCANYVDPMGGRCGWCGGGLGWERRRKFERKRYREAIEGWGEEEGRNSPQVGIPWYGRGA